MASVVNNCVICLQPLGETFEVKEADGPTKKYVTTTLHSPNGIPHQFHRICIHEWFVEMGTKSDLPLKCPLCKERVSFIEASGATGVDMEKVVEFIIEQELFIKSFQMARNRPPAAPTSQSWCAIL